MAYPEAVCCVSDTLVWFSLAKSFSDTTDLSRMRCLRHSLGNVAKLQACNCITCTDMWRWVQLIEEVTRNKRLQRWRAIMAAWQRILPDMFPSMKVGFCPCMLPM